jgi:hypothetical protein
MSSKAAIGISGFFAGEIRQQRRVLGVIVLCLIGFVIGVTLVAYAQSHQILLISTASPKRDVQATTVPTIRTTTTLVGAVPHINQTDVSQYADTAELKTWSAVSCSTASLTALFDSYGYTYRITDVLKIQRGQNAISSAGALNGFQGISDTAKYFGFKAENLKGNWNAVEQALQNKTPILAGVTNAQKWPFGHYLVLTGTRNGRVQIMDPWPATNLQDLSIADFKGYWDGTAVRIEPNPTSVLGKPTISATQINQVLAAYQSPAIGKGQALYDLGIQYGIDPAFALAFFLHESTFGKNGIARESLSLGNLRCIPDHECKNNFAYFASWEEGFRAWYELIRNLYVAQWGCATVEQIIPKYAPSADNNNEAAYIAAVEHAVETWRERGIEV